MLAAEGGDHLFDLSGDDVALRERIHIKHLADQPFRQQMLDEHFVYGFLADVGVQRRFA